MIQFSILPKSTPMWVGWNTQHRIDKKATEKIWYLPAINQSPTSTVVVKETMKKAQQLAVECGKCEIALTYDLAIAKMAMEIQTEEALTSDNIFVTLGSFHIEMAFFSVIGKYISESGGPHLLTESGIIENGSLISFLLGKSYKRSKRIHQLFAMAMEIPHFNSFKLSMQEDDLEKFISLEDDLPNVVDGDKKKLMAEHTNELIKKYEEFAQETRNGNHGKTAQYWMGYVDMLHLYHEFSRSIRTGDLDLYIYCLQQMTALFFTFNHQNYSR